MHAMLLNWTIFSGLSLLWILVSVWKGQLSTILILPVAIMYLYITICKIYAKILWQFFWKWMTTILHNILHTKWWQYWKWWLMQSITIITQSVPFPQVRSNMSRCPTCCWRDQSPSFSGKQVLNIRVVILSLLLSSPSFSGKQVVIGIILSIVIFVAGTSIIVISIIISNIVSIVSHDRDHCDHNWNEP